MRAIQAKFAKIALVLGVFLTPATWAADFPSQAVRLVVPVQTGGSTDLMGRLLAAGMEKQLAQRVFVENRPGAASAIGSEAVVRSKPDGHTLLFSGLAQAVYKMFHKTPNYDPLVDLMPVSMVAQGWTVLGVVPSLPVNTFGELVAYSKANPQKLNYGSFGLTATMLQLEDLKKRTGMQLLEVPYTGVASFTQAMLSNQVQVGYDTTNTLNTAKARILLQGGPKRSKALPDVPTAAELGFPDWYGGFFFGIFVPRGTPAEVVARLSSAITEALRDPELAEALNKAGGGSLDVGGSTPDRFADFLVRRTREFEATGKAIGIKPE